MINKMILRVARDIARLILMICLNQNRKKVKKMITSKAQ